MPNTVLITERFPTWAAASATRNRLAQDGGFDQFGIARVSIDHIGSEFALVIQADELHQEEIRRLLGSSGAMFNRSLGEARTGKRDVTGSVLMFAVIAATGAIVFTLLRRRYRRPDQREHWHHDLLSDVDVVRKLGQKAETEPQARWLEGHQQAGLRSHTEGYAV